MNKIDELVKTIETGFNIRNDLNSNYQGEIRKAVDSTMKMLHKGKIRVCSQGENGKWQVHQWIKKAVLLSFRLYDNEVMKSGYTNYFDKVHSKFANFTDEDFKAGGYRVVPNAIARRGSFIGKNVVNVGQTIFTPFTPWCLWRLNGKNGVKYGVYGCQMVKMV